MSWEGNYFGKDGALKKASEKYEDSDQSPEDRISYASALHSAAGRALAAVRHGRIWMLPVAFFLGWRALDQIEMAWGHPDSERLHKLPSKIDVSCAVWRRWGWIYGGRSDRARMTLKRFGWYESLNDEEIPAHTRAFIIVHVLSLGLNRNKKEEWRGELRTLARQAEREGERNQAGRVYKYIDQLLGDEEARRKAVALAGSDQRYKMGA